MEKAKKERRKHRNMYQDEKGRWCLDYYTLEGKRRRKTVGSFEDAKAELSKIGIDKHNGVFVDPGAVQKFESFAQTYLDTISIEKKSHTREQSIMKQLVKVFGNYRLNKIKRPMIRKYRNKRTKEVSRATVNREIALLRHMFNVALEDSLIASNPARAGKTLKSYKEFGRTRFLEKDEIDRLMTAIRARIARTKGKARKSLEYLYTIVLIAMHTGMRKGEILNLRWNQINWERRFILLAGADTKTGESRKIPLDSFTMEEFVAHRMRVSHEELVFPSYDLDGNVVPLKDVKVGFKRVLKDAAIYNFRFHDLRHTFGSHYMMTVGNLYKLSIILGHSSTKMTERYTQHSPDYIIREGERMDTIWTPTPEPTTSLPESQRPNFLQ